MKKIIFLLTISICQFICGQEDYSKYKPVEPLFNGGGVDKFYEYLSNNIDFTKVKSENEVLIGFVLGKDGKMNHIKVSFCSTTEAEQEITLVLQKASKWDVSNQKNKDLFICFKMKLFFSGKQVKGLSKTMWLTNDIQDIDIKKNEFPDSTIKLKKQEEVDNPIYSAAGIDVKPEYPGGMSEFYSFIGKNYVVPNVKDLKGRVIVSFVVEKDGSLTDIKVLKDIGFGTGEEAIRVLKLSEKWSPASQNGKLVRCSYQLPISIELKK